MSDLVRNPNCWFSHATAQMKFLMMCKPPENLFRGFCPLGYWVDILWIQKYNVRLIGSGQSVTNVLILCALLKLILVMLVYSV